MKDVNKAIERVERDFNLRLAEESLKAFKIGYEIADSDNCSRESSQYKEVRKRNKNLEKKNKIALSGMNLEIFNLGYEIRKIEIQNENNL